MVVGGSLDGCRWGKRQEEDEPTGKYKTQAWVRRMDGLARDETAEPVSRDQFFRRQLGGEQRLYIYTL